jgi:hypothetical protein
MNNVLSKAKFKLIISGILFLLLIFLINRVNLSPNSILVEFYMPESDSDCRLFYDIGNGFNESDSIVCKIQKSKYTVKAIFFEVPCHKLKTLKIIPATYKGTVIIKSIKISHRFSKLFLNFSLYQWLADDIIRDFKPVNYINDFIKKNDLLYIKSTETDSYLYYTGDLNIVKNTISKKIFFIKIFLYFIGLILSFMLFLLLNFIKTSGKKIHFLAQMFLICMLIIVTCFSLFKIFENLTFDGTKQYNLNYFFINLKSLQYSFISLSVIIMLTLVIEKKLYKHQYVIMAIPLIIILISGKINAFFAVFIFLLANLAAGISVSKYFNSEINTQQIISSIFIGCSINSILIWIALHFKINFTFTYYLFFLLEIFIFRKLLKECLSKINITNQSIHFNWSQKIIFISSCFTLIYTLVPGYLCDDLSIHLYIPKYVAIHGFFNFDPHYIISLDMSIIPKCSYTSVFLMGNEYAVRLLNYVLFYLAFILIETFTRKTFGTRPSFFVVLIVILTPFVLLQISLIFTDSFAFISSLVVFIYFFSIFKFLLNKKSLILYFLLSAFAFLCKQQAVFIIIPTGLVIGYIYIREILVTKKYTIILNLLSGFLCFSIILLPFLLQNYILTGNPLFPWFNEIFKSKWFSGLVTIYDNLNLNWKTIYDITFYGSKYIENINYSFGTFYFIFFPFLPIIFIDKKKIKENSLFLFIFTLSIFLWSHLTHLYIRYFIGIVPIGSIIIALIMDKILLLDIVKNIKVIKYIIIAIFIITFTTNLIYQLNIITIPTPYPIIEVFTQNHTNSSLGYCQTIKKVFDFASIKYGSNSKCLLIGSQAMYFADFDIETISWYHYVNQQEIFFSATNAEELYNNIFIKNKFNFIIMPDALYPPFNSDIFINFKKTLITEFSSGGYILALPGNDSTLKITDKGETKIFIEKIYPSSITAGEDFQLQPNGMSAIAIEGKNFVSGCTIYLNNEPLATAYGNENTISALIAKKFYLEPGLIEIYVKYKNEESNKINIKIINK